jgi:hypothetical protein
MSNVDPENMDSLEAEGVPDLLDTVTSDQAEGIMPPRDYPQGALEHGTTAAEERRGETLAQRVAREEPDVLRAELDDEAGRLVEPDAGGAPDNEAAAVAELSGDGDALSAEESAMHITEEP